MSNFFTTKQDTESWLKDMDITRYSINDDLSVNIYGDLSLYILTKSLPVKFNIVKGDMTLVKSGITSMDGFPEEIHGSLLAYNNQLKTLKGAPTRVGENFDISGNKLKSLEYAPLYIGGNFELYANKIKDFKGLNPETEIKGFIRGMVRAEDENKIKKEFEDYKKQLIQKDLNDTVKDHLKRKPLSVKRDVRL